MNINMNPQDILQKLEKASGNLEQSSNLLKATLDDIRLYRKTESKRYLNEKKQLVEDMREIVEDMDLETLKFIDSLYSDTTK